MESTVSIILGLIRIYLLLGILFTSIFVWKGLGKVDPGTQGTSVFFKLLLIPGLIVFWIVFLRKWIRTKSQ